MGSRNGTLLNDVRLTAETVVTTGDVITIGRAKFRLETASD
ncbi:MAG: FHA domain-containing protein [Chloroflexota bacterium]